jgi:hypothetical protein
MDPALQAALADWLAPEIEELREITGKPLLAGAPTPVGALQDAAGG